MAPLTSSKVAFPLLQPLTGQFFLLCLAFQLVQQTVREIGVDKRITLIFMTDGCDSCNRPNAILDAQTKLQSFLKKSARHCTVHVIGYSTDHDLSMMNSLKNLGATEGIYRYAEGSSGLDEKFSELFELADLNVEFTLKLPDVNEPIKLVGEIIEGNIVEAECWLSLNATNKEPLEINIGSHHYQAVPTFVEPDVVFTLKSFSRRAKAVTTQVELDQLQSELQQVKMFGKTVGGTKDSRQVAMVLRTELQVHLDSLHTIMADLARGTMNQTAALAKMNDLRYADK